MISIDILFFRCDCAMLISIRLCPIVGLSVGRQVGPLLFLNDENDFFEVNSHQLISETKKPCVMMKWSHLMYPTTLVFCDVVPPGENTGNAFSPRVSAAPQCPSISNYYAKN